MNIDSDTKPLISIILSTYNSINYVIETLESIRAQTYPNLELIVSDDYSIDGTVEKCSEWIEEFGPRFTRTELQTSPKNTGVTINATRGLLKAHGEWIKFIAGDDILLETCIEKNILFAELNNESKIIFSDINFISEDSNRIVTPSWYRQNDKFFNKNCTEQNKDLLINGNSIMAVSFFINKNTLLSLNGFDQRIPYIEDYPLWLRATSKGFRLFYFPETTVSYRIRKGSLSNDAPLCSRKSNYLTFKYYRSKQLMKLNILIWYEVFIHYYIDSRKTPGKFRFLEKTSVIYWWKLVKKNISLFDFKATR